MIRTVRTAILSLLIVTAALVSGGHSRAAAPPKGMDERKKKDAEIKALQAQIAMLSQMRDAELRGLDARLHEELVRLGQAEERETRERAELGPEEARVLKGIDDRFNYIIEHLEPKKVRQELEAGVKTLRHVHEVISEGAFDYGGRRRAAQLSVAAAEERLKKALAHDTRQERAGAAKDLHSAHTDVKDALEYSVKKYGLANDGRKREGEPESRAAANLQLWESLFEIDNTQRLLKAVDHEITDYEHERKELRKIQLTEKEKTREHFRLQAERLGKEIERQKLIASGLPQKTGAAKKVVWDQTEAKIKAIRGKIAQLRK